MIIENKIGRNSILEITAVCTVFCSSTITIDGERRFRSYVEESEVSTM
jgi:hypothetical protein